MVSARCSCILLNFFNPWTTECEGGINKASSSAYGESRCLSTEAWPDEPYPRLPDGGGQAMRAAGIHDAGPASAYVLSCRCGHPRRHQLWAKYKSNNLSGVWYDRCDWHEVKLMFQCYLDDTAASCHRQAVGDWRPPCSCTFRQHQRTVLERFCIVSNGRHVGLRGWTALVDSLQSPKQMFRSCYVDVGVAWVVSTWRAINSITGDTFWKLSTRHVKR